MTIESLKKRALRNPDVKAEYEALHDEFDLIDQLLTMRSQAGLTQEQVALRMNTQKATSVVWNEVMETKVGRP